MVDIHLDWLNWLYYHILMVGIVCRRFEPFLLYTTLPILPTPLFILFWPPCFWQDFSTTLPHGNTRQTQKKLVWQSYFFISWRLKNNVICVFIKTTFISNTRLRFNPKKFSTETPPPLYELTPIFYRKTLLPTSMIFQKSQPPIYKGVHNM